MIERQIPTPQGTFSLCRCGAEPRQIMVLGRTLRETGSDVPATRYMLECQCGRSTAKHATLLAAETEWGPLLSQRPLGLPAPIARLPRRRAPRTEVQHG